MFAEEIYDGIYTGRGNAGNRIDELKVHLKADRLNFTRCQANPFRFLESGKRRQKQVSKPWTTHLETFPVPSHRSDY